MRWLDIIMIPAYAIFLVVDICIGRTSWAVFDVGMLALLIAMVTTKEKG